MKAESGVADGPLRSVTPAAVTAERIARCICDAHGVSEGHWQRALLAPLREFLNRRGKGFRGSLVAASWRLGGGAPHALPDELPLVLELLHAGSLIIDDIEDGSLTRRGGPALHLLCGLGVALNTGNWLYFAASSLVDELELSASIKLQILRQVRAAVLRCHHGQALDLSVKISEVDPKEIENVVGATTALKTASLLEMAATLGAVAANAPSSIVSALARFGRDLGTALQMFDDLGSVTAPERRDKGIEDLRSARPTWIWVWASKLLSEIELRRLQNELREVEQGAPVEPLMEELKELVGVLGQLVASARTQSAYQRLVLSVPPSPALDTIAGELKRLEESYV